MMRLIGDRQIKAARALLDWSQDDLAQAARLSVATIRKLELGGISPRCSTTTVIREAFERAGIEFLDSEGVRRKQEDVSVYQGREVCDAFLEDVSRTVARQGGDVMIVAGALLGLNGMFGAQAPYLEDFSARHPGTSIKVILPDALDVPMSFHRAEFRSLSTSYVDSMPFCVYGDKYAVLTSGESELGKIIVIQSSVTAMAGRRQFYSMWDKAMAFHSFIKEPKKSVAFAG